jgi:high-affinity iron transporter
MAGQAAALLASDDFLPTLGDQLWNLHAILPDDGYVGRPLHVLVGYADRPPGVQMAAWGATLLFLAMAERALRQPHRR